MSSSKKRSRAGEDGYTLLEVLIVLAITALLAAIVGPRVMQHFTRAKHDAARVQLSNIATALELYYMDCGTYPSSEQGLRALVRPQEDGERCQGPYLQKADGLLDPWRVPFRYTMPGEHGTYDLYSLGSDNLEGGESDKADITSW